MYARKCCMGESYRHGRSGRKEVIKNNDYVIVIDVKLSANSGRTSYGRTLQLY